MPTFPHVTLPVLVLDDSASMLYVLCRASGAIFPNAEIVESATAKAAAAALLSRPAFAFVLSDWNLGPRETAATFVGVAARQYHYPTAVVSSDFDSGSVKGYFAAGAHAFVSKINMGPALVDAIADAYVRAFQATYRP